jgi:electron transfer flavoprotein beta subunit
MPKNQLNSVVLVKQVPDTKNITADTMKADGTVNRGALPAIFNPEDLNALEMALDTKERFGGTITVITMGPPRAAEILKESLYRGADKCILITDRRFAGADTLATSYVLAQAIHKINSADLIFCGRQAIDGDTAQIGPQVAEKIDFNQITYVNDIVKIKNRAITVKRILGRSTETIATNLPLLMTVSSSANSPRSIGAKYYMKFKKAKIVSEIKQDISSKFPKDHFPSDKLKNEIQSTVAELKKQDLFIETWSADDLDADPEQIGLTGSPTKVKAVKSVTLTATEIKTVEPTLTGVQDLITELITDNTFG